MRFLFLLLMTTAFIADLIAEPVVSTLTQVQATAGMSVAEDGTLYVADFGDINTLAGTSLYKISPDGQSTLITNQLNTGPSGNLIDDDGSILQSVYLSNSVVRVSQNGDITNVASGIPGPDDLIKDAQGNIYVATCPFTGGGGGVYKIDNNGQVSVFATDSSLGCLSGITMDDNGDFFVAGFTTGGVSKITPDGQISSFAQLPSGGSHIKFGNNEFYVMMPRINQVARVDRAGNVSILAGTGARENIDGSASEAAFRFPFHLEISPDGKKLYVNGGPDGDTTTNPIRIIDLFPETETEAIKINAGLNGAWFNAETSAQGFMIEVLPARELVFFAWFTYDTMLADSGITAVIGNPGHRWLSGQGMIMDNRVKIDLLNTSGGLFMSAQEAQITDPGAYGTVTLSFTSCTSGQLSYNLANDLNGSVALQRIADDNVALCEMLSQDEQ
ncbi:hypothetical protein [Marinicella sp. W31]|uniref:hypothetical protein n=1 Tax=Marinicella sp. W31 TaxID=3023713 RepID=UPI003757B57E